MRTWPRSTRARARWSSRATTRASGSRRWRRSRAGRRSQPVTCRRCARCIGERVELLPARRHRCARARRRGGDSAGSGPAELDLGGRSARHLGRVRVGGARSGRLHLPARDCRLIVSRPGPVRVFEQQRHGAVIHQLDLHVGAEDAAPGARQAAEVLVQRLRLLARRGGGIARAVPAARVAVERELAHAEDLPLPQRLVHAAVGVREDPQRLDLGRQALGIGFAVGAC